MNINRDKKTRLDKSAATQLAALAFSIIAVIYICQARTRMTATLVAVIPSDQDGGAYVAKYYYLRYKETAMVRVYRADDGALLAEREFGATDDVELNWEKNRLIYGGGDSIFYNGILNLPPSRMDRMLAWMP